MSKIIICCDRCGEVINDGEYFYKTAMLHTRKKVPAGLPDLSDKPVSFNFIYDEVLRDKENVSSSLKWILCFTCNNKFVNWAESFINKGA